MNLNSPNIVLLETAADLLGELCSELVLVGGCAVGLLITDPAHPPSRITSDVDLTKEIISIASYYNELLPKLEKQGFIASGDVICRHERSGVLIDVMPSEDIGLGFSNSWYPLVIKHANEIQLSNGYTLKVITAPLFIATKLESFHSRGGGDLWHHDMEDIINVVDGRPEIVDEVEDSDSSVREYIKDEIDVLLADIRFADTIFGFLDPDPTSQARATVILERLRKIAGA